MGSLIPPLNSQVEIVDENGKPTPYFTRLLTKLTSAGIAGAGLTSNGSQIALATMAAKTILANKTSLTASPTACTISDILDFVSATRGTILYRGASGWSALAPGTAGYLLQTNGAGADPTWVVAPTGGGGGGGTPSIRASRIGGANAASITVLLPAGTIAGDVVVANATSGWNVIIPTGWVQLNLTTTGSWFGGVFAKVMTAADITTGSVTVTFSGSYYCVLSLVTLTGTTVSGVAGISANSAGGAASVPISNTSVSSTNRIIGFFTNRGNSTDTCSNFTTLQTVSQTDGSGAIGNFTGTLGPLGVSETITYSTAGSYYYWAVVGFK